MVEQDPLVESHNAEAVNAQAVAEEAKQKAFHAELVGALREVLADNDDDDSRPMLIKRIPLICNDIRGIHEMLIKMEGTLTLVSRLVFGFVAIILMGVMGAVGTVVLTVLSAKQ